MQNNIIKKIITVISLSLIVAFTIPQVLPAVQSVDVAHAAVKLNKKSAAILVGKSVRLKISGTKKKVTWKTSDKKIATVSTNGLVKGIKSGKATISAKVGKKTYKCKVTVKLNQFKQSSPSLKKLESGYIHFYPMKVYYSKGKLYYKARIYNRKPFRVSRLSNIRIAVTAPDGSAEGRLLAEKEVEEIDLAALNKNSKGQPVKLSPGKYAEYNFVFSGRELLVKNFDLTKIKKIYYVAAYDWEY